jgi:hypothetical protein
MRVSLPILVQDRWAAERDKIKPLEHFYAPEGDLFRDGPANDRLAIQDVDEDSGETFAGALFQPPSGRRKIGRYRIADEKDLSARDLNQVCTFSAVKRTLDMVEESDALGRKVAWAFDAPQLSILPRAGRWANAFYERESHSLKFYYFSDPKRPGETVFTSLSRDIVAHETGHAILDGIAPHLYNAVTPQSLALHEGIADLTAVLTNFRSPTLRQAVLKRTNGSIDQSTAFSAIAEEYGQALDQTNLAGFLRNLYNQRTLDPDDRSVDPLTLRPNYDPSQEPHSLCQVLSGAIYATLARSQSVAKKRLALEGDQDEYSLSGKALFLTAEIFKRMIFRGLDYLPPGEISFADYGRALIAADQASHPDDDQQRQWLMDEFTRRKITSNRASLEVRTNYEHPAVEALDLETLLADEAQALRFAEQNRPFLHIPPAAAFKVTPRLKVTKTYYHLDGKKTSTELLYKVWWSIDEPNPLGARYPARRSIAQGTTLAIDWQTRRVRALLTTAAEVYPAEADQQRLSRDQFLSRLAETGQFTPGAAPGLARRLHDYESGH